LDLGIVLIEKGKDHIEVELSEPVGNVLLEPLKERLLADDTVDLATHDSDHPMYGKRRLFVRVKSGKPQNAVKRALKDLGSDFSSASKATEKAKVAGEKKKPKTSKKPKK
jgi:DNA-directed RNA polymerase subunit L